MSKNLQSFNSFDKDVFLSNKTIRFLTYYLTKEIKDNRVITDLIESYKLFIVNNHNLYGHGTGSYPLEEIIKSGYIFPSSKLLTGEGATDIITSSRKFSSFSKIDSVHNLFMVTFFSLLYTKEEKLKKEFSFLADKEFPQSFLKDIAYLQQRLYPEIVGGRVKKMLKLKNTPQNISKEDINSAYNLWFQISSKRESFRSRKVESLLIEAFNFIRESFLKNIYPVVSVNGIKTYSIKEISEGLNIYTPHNLEEAKYHLLRTIYRDLIKQGVLNREMINNQEKNKAYITKEVLKVLSYESPYYLKILDPKKNSKLLQRLENQFPVIICFTLPKNLESKVFENTVTHMTYELKSTKNISIKNFKYILVPYSRIRDIKKIISNTTIQLLPLEIIEMIRCILHIYEYGKIAYPVAGNSSDG